MSQENNAPVETMVNIPSLKGRLQRAEQYLEQTTAETIPEKDLYALIYHGIMYQWEELPDTSLTVVRTVKWLEERLLDENEEGPTPEEMKNTFHSLCQRYERTHLTYPVDTNRDTYE